MTEPDEAHAAWEACACDRFEDEQNGNPLDLPQGMPNFADFRDGYRAGQAESAERIKALEEVAQNLIALFDYDDHEVSARAWDEALDEARKLLKEADQ